MVKKYIKNWQEIMLEVGGSVGDQIRTNKSPIHELS